MYDSLKLNRRQLVKLGAAGSASAIIARTGYAQDALLSPTDPTAMALGYHEDHSKVDTTKWSRKAGPAGDQQNCVSCKLYVEKGEGNGSCSIFPGKLVRGAGWCNAWIAR